MNYAETGEIVDQWFKALNAKDFDAMMSLYAPDAVQYEAPIRRTKIGRDHVRARLKKLTDASGDFHAEISTICIAQNKAAVAITYEGTNTAPYLGHKPTGKHFILDTCFILECRQGKIVRHTTYIDTATILRAMGLTDIPKWHEEAA